MLLMHCWYDRDTALRDNALIINVLIQAAKLIPVVGEYIFIISVQGKHSKETVIVQLTGTTQVSHPMTVAEILHLF